MLTMFCFALIMWGIWGKPILMVSWFTTISITAQVGEIGLRQLEQKLKGKELLIMIVPAEKHSGGQRYVPTGMAFRPDSEGERIATINQISLIPEYKTPVHLS